MSRWPISTKIRRTLNHGADGDALVAVALGTPHFSPAEFRTLDGLLDAFDGKPACDFYVNTSRFILWELGETGLASRVRRARHPDRRRHLHVHHARDEATVRGW